ncbi:MAG: TetR/AcrR family transcriptional regulator; helix-turn-helix transcriptional regulator [Gammaproteobacteria bacterium]|nr:TetR/AcrR family transcriptional regulator; helix-turn-helix transcriptional regulator [Gammaproteobacteria bacterium]
MPKIVDHDAQRLLFAEAAMRLIAQNGLEGVTMRAVAAEAGLSYGSLFHYFASKDELLMYAVRRVTSAQTQRVNEFSSRFSGLKALEHLLCDDTIINASSRDAWMVWLTFLYKAALQQSFAKMHKELIDGWVDRIAGLLEDARRTGDVQQGVDVGLEAVAIWAYSAGIGQMGLLDPARLPPKRQKRLIRLYLDRLRSA